MPDLDGLFAPARVAVIGATPREGAVGRAVTRNLVRDFAGEVVAVNPRYDEVLGAPCVGAIADAGAVDLAVVVVPADVCVPVVREVGEAGIRHVVVITAGFAEAGSEGAARERALREVAAEYDLALVGPNSLGVMSTPVGLNATFGPQSALPGGLSFMSQSGAFVTAALDWATDRGIGFKDVVSLGNEAVLDETDFVRAWADDPDTDVVLGYLEGIDDGRGFIEAARDATRDTPIVLVKAGRTAAGATAASSHTGAIAGSETAYAAGLAQAGVLRANTVEELFDVASTLAGQPVPAGDGVGIVTNAGGPGVMATDALGGTRLDLASFEPATVAALDDVLPATAAVHNPVDVIGDADLDRFRAALDVVLADANVHAGVVLSAPTAILPYDALAAAVVECHEAHGKPVVACLMGGASAAAAAETLRGAGIPNYFDPARAVRSLDALARYRAISAREYAAPMRFDIDEDRVRGILGDAADRGRRQLGVEALGLLDAVGIPTPPGAMASTPREAEAAARELDGPVVMKLASPDLTHKSDIGGVRVGVPAADVASTYEDLVARARRYSPDATVLGVLVQAMIDVDAGVETILGATTDPQFGPLCVFGLGGIHVEVLEDVVVRVAPVSEPEARAMTGDLRAAPLLRGARGRAGVDLDAVVDAIGRLSHLATAVPAILELDVNPLLATPDGVTALDLRLTIDPDRLETP